MAIIDENGMSKKLVEFCNENRTFRKEFVNLFTEKKNIKKIEFTGYSETGYGEPDITITFEDDSVFYIEVKTRGTTGFQENQVTNEDGYSKLIKRHKQDLKDSFAYLLDNNHATEECLVENIVYWQDVLALVKDFNNIGLAKDIAQNVDGICSDEKLFGPDEELFSNPFQLAVFSNQILRREKNKKAYNWVFNTFLMPGLSNLGCTDVNVFSYTDFDDNPSTLVEFKYQGKEIHTQFNHTGVWKNSTEGEWVGDYYFSSFTFYRPWIVGVRNATNENELQKLTEKAVRLWFKDLKNIINGNSYIEDEEYYSTGYFGDKAEVYGNPIILSNISGFLHEASDIYDDLLIPALKQIDGIRIKNTRFDLEGRRSVKFEYEDNIYAVNVFGFMNLKVNTINEYNSFTYYRPWIVGVHKAKTVEEMIEYTVQSLELWIYDNKTEGLI